MAPLSPERKAEILAQYHAEKAKRDAENQALDQETLERRTLIQAKINAMRLNEIHVATKDYMCQCCGKTISKGSQYRRSNIPTGYGALEGTHYTQRITHLVCAITKEGPK